MNYITYCVLYGLLVLSMIAAGVWLVITEHYGWAWIPWLWVCCVKFRPYLPSLHPSEHVLDAAKTRNET